MAQAIALSLRWAAMDFVQQASGRTTAAAEEAGFGTRGSFPRLRFRSFAWIPLALSAVAIATGLFPEVFRDSEVLAEPSAVQTVAKAEAPAASQSAVEGKFIQAGGYSLPLPANWRQTRRPPGTAFAAVSNDGLATTTLWIERHPDLDFEAFESRSLRSLSMLGENARTTDRVEGATIESSSAQLRADLPAGSGLTSTYLVTLRASGPYRYHLATTIQPGSPPRVLAGAEAVADRLRPWVTSD